MYGIGIGRGMAITLKRFVSTFVNDLKWLGTRNTPETFAIRQGTQSEGIFTVEYPEEKIAVPERFRFVPFLVMNNLDDSYAPGHDWCTSCGICAKVCPPQCIWIVRGTDANGRPKPEPEAFFIDIDICMNCGYCSEYCPFDAIKMDHDYELASYDRITNHIYDKKRLSKEVRYWQTIAPTTALEEAVSRGQWEHKDTLKVAKKAGVTMTEPVWEKRETAKHDPNIVANMQAEQARLATQVIAPAQGLPIAGVATAPQPVRISLDVEGAAPEKLSEWAADESLPMPARAAAALRLERMIADKTFKPSSADRKAISAAKKVAKDQNTTIEDLAKDFKGGEVVIAAAPAPVAQAVTPAQAVAPVAAPAAPAISIDVEGADPVQLSTWAADEGLPLAARAAAAVKLEAKISSKEYKPTSADRKAISAAKKVAKDADSTIEDLAATFKPGEVAAVVAAPVAAPIPTPVAAPSAPAPTSTPIPAAVPSIDLSSANPDQLMQLANDESQSLAARAAAGLRLDEMIRNKEFKPTGNHRKAISAAKKAASDAGTTIEDAAKG